MSSRATKVTALAIVRHLFCAKYLSVLSILEMPFLSLELPVLKLTVAFVVARAFGGMILAYLVSSVIAAALSLSQVSCSMSRGRSDESFKNSSAGGLIDVTAVFFFGAQKIHSTKVPMIGRGNH